MASIVQSSRSPWRDDLRPASFKGKSFHVEVGSRTSGRRNVLHEYPKKDTPYAEDMGRIGRSFLVVGYIVQYPSDSPVVSGLPPDSASLRQRDYRIARDQLVAALEEESIGGAELILPTMTQSMLVQCIHYTVSEYRERGGYCQFDMNFVEAGRPAWTPIEEDVGSLIGAAARSLVDATIETLQKDLTQ